MQYLFIPTSVSCQIDPFFSPLLTGSRKTKICTTNQRIFSTTLFDMILFIFSFLCASVLCICYWKSMHDGSCNWIELCKIERCTIWSTNVDYDIRMDDICQWRYIFYIMYFEKIAHWFRMICLRFQQGTQSLKRFLLTHKE